MTSTPAASRRSAERFIDVCAGAANNLADIKKRPSFDGRFLGGKHRN